MSELQAFFAKNAEMETTEEFIVSERFKDKNGTAIPWKLRTISETENEGIRKAATKMVKGKNGVRTPETNIPDYMTKMAVASVVFPNLKDSELQNSYGVVGADELLKTMLLSGEYANLLQKVQEMNGFDRDINETVEEIKN